LRTFFGWLYLYLPHAILLVLVGVWAGILIFIAWWAILFTTRYPREFFDFQTGFLRWSTRVSARLFNLVDGYPAFGVNVSEPAIVVDVLYPDALSRGSLLLKTFLGFIYVLIPHT